MKISINFFVLLSLLFIILQDNTILLGTQLIYTAPIFILVLLFIFALIKFKMFTFYIMFALKKTPLKYLIYFILYLLFTTYLHGDSLTTIKILNRIMLIFGLIVLPVSLYSVIFIPRFLSFNKIFKIFVYSTFLILLYGLFDYFFKLILKIKTPLYYIFCSRSYFNATRYQFFNNSNEILERACSIFFEPSFFATFIFLFLPLIYIILKFNNKILKTKALNLLFNILLLILAWLCLFLTKSPFYIIFSILYTLAFFFKDISNILRKNPLKLISFIILLCIFFHVACSIKNPMISRINKIIKSFGNMETLIVADGSFATRILATQNTFLAFKSVPLLGCGYGNGSDIMYKQYKNTKTALTEEIITKQILIYRTDPSPNIFWSMLLQTGIIGTLLLYSFFIKTIVSAFKIQKDYYKKDRLFLKILTLIAINYMIITFYWSIDSYPMMWFVFGLLNSYIMQSKFRKHKLEEIQCQNSH